MRRSETMTGRSGNPDGFVQPARREFLERSVISSAAWAIAGALRSAALRAESPVEPAEKEARMLKAHIGNGIRLPNCGGDVWTTTWADQDHLYGVPDDTAGVTKA